MPEVERPLGAFVAFFLEITMIRFCLDLMRNEDFLESYKQGKGGMLMHAARIAHCESRRHRCF